MVKKKILKENSYPLIKARIAHNTNKIYSGKKVAPVYRVWQNDTGWFARVYDTVQR